MADIDATLSNLFGELKRLEYNAEYEKALKTANKSTLLYFPSFPRG